MLLETFPSSPSALLFMVSRVHERWFSALRGAPLFFFDRFLPETLTAVFFLA